MNVTSDTRRGTNLRLDSDAPDGGASGACFNIPFTIIPLYNPPAE